MFLLEIILSGGSVRAYVYHRLVMNSLTVIDCALKEIILSVVRCLISLK